MPSELGAIGYFDPKLRPKRAERGGMGAHEPASRCEIPGSIDCFTRGGTSWTGAFVPPGAWRPFRCRKIKHLTQLAAEHSGHAGAISTQLRPNPFGNGATGPGGRSASTVGFFSAFIGKACRLRSRKSARRRAAQQVRHSCSLRTLCRPQCSLSLSASSALQLY